MDSTLVNIINQLYAIPNAPFSMKAREKYIKDKIKEAGLDIEETSYFILTKLTSEKRDRRVIFMSHLDHPGFVLKNKNEGTAFGTLYLDQIKNFQPLNVYTKEGDYLGDVKIKKVLGTDQRKIEIDSDFEIPINSQALWNVGAVKYESEYHYGRSHDNDILTSILINNLKKLDSKDFEIVFLFTKHEEVLQQSSFNIAKNNSINISESDLVINLESMKVFPTTENSEYSNLNYSDGVVLQISETTTIYGNNNGQPNLTESLINNVAQAINLKLQRGLSGGFSDARQISLFGLTNNIVTLNIPNEFKHNVSGENVVAERIRMDDVKTLDSIVKNIFQINTLPLNNNPNDISMKVKQEFPEFNKKNMKSFLKLNTRLDFAYRDIIKREYFYPESILDSLKDIFWKSISYLNYIFSKIG